MTSRRSSVATTSCRVTSTVCPRRPESGRGTLSLLALGTLPADRRRSARSRRSTRRWRDSSRRPARGCSSDPSCGRRPRTSSRACSPRRRPKARSPTRNHRQHVHAPARRRGHHGQHDRLDLAGCSRQTRDPEARAQGRTGGPGRGARSRRPTTTVDSALRRGGAAGVDAPEGGAAGPGVEPIADTTIGGTHIPGGTRLMLLTRSEHATTAASRRRASSIPSAGWGRARSSARRTTPRRFLRSGPAPASVPGETSRFWSQRPRWR